MSKNKHGIFGGIKGAKSVDSLYFTPGIYWARIDKNKVDNSRKGRTFCANEFTIVRVIDDMDGKSLRVGQSPSHLMFQDSDYFNSDINGFIGNTMGLDCNSVTEEHAEQIYGDEQPLVGTVVEISVRTIVTKQGTDFNRITYVREVKAEELLKTLPEEIIDRFFPGNVLEAMVEAEADS